MNEQLIKDVLRWIITTKNTEMLDESDIDMVYKDYVNEKASMCDSEHIAPVMHSNATEIENLKCCGNCNHRSTIDMGSYSDETCDKDNNLSSWQYCKKWEFDGIERSGRTEGFNV